MAQIVLCNAPVSSNTLENTLGMTAEKITGVGCINPNTLNAYQPYLASDSTPTASDFAILNQFGSGTVTKELTNLSLCYGEDNTLALAEISDKLQGAGIGVMGASSSVYGNRLASFTDSVKNYQDALLKYRDAMKSGRANKALAKQNVTRAFGKMQFGFKQELNSVNAGIKSGQKALAINNPTRAMNIARSSRNTVKLELTSQVQASQLARFGKSTKFLGNGLVVIDFASRVGNVHNSYAAGENWERELFIESMSFATSATAGVVTVNAGTAALGFLMVATPIGWVGLIIGGIAVAGVAAGASIWTNNQFKNNSGNWYDSIMSWLD